MTQGSDLAWSRDGRRTHPLTGLVVGLLWGAAVAAGIGWQTFDGDSLENVAGTAIFSTVGFVLGILAGLVSWWATRYVIDDAEVRLESGVLFRKSRRLPYERIQSVDINQPLIARLIGLSELTIESAGGADSNIRVRFVPAREASDLRRDILQRVHGAHPDDDPLELETRFDGQVVEKRDVILTVPPSWIIIGTILSLDFVVSLLVVVVSLILAVTITGGWVIAGIALPAAIGLVNIVSTRIITQWDFTLSQGPRGLRIDRGLLSRSSQSIPFDRVQGIAQISPLVWRQYGWVRLDIDVAGYGAVTSTETTTSNTLLPIGTKAAGEFIEQLLIPDPSFEQRHTTKVTRRSRWFAPIGWRFRSITISAHAVRTATGWLTRTLTVVPAHKLQSEAIDQGPLQRRLGVATLNVHTPTGPVNSQVRHLDTEDSRALFDALQPPLVGSSAPASSSPSS